jgi:hypothetical protein
MCNCPQMMYRFHSPVLTCLCSVRQEKKHEILRELQLIGMNRKCKNCYLLTGSTVGCLISFDFWNCNDPKYSGVLGNDTLSLLGTLFLTFLKNIVHLKHSEQLTQHHSVIS